MVGNGAFSHKIDYFRKFMEIINLDGHPNRITGSKVTTILLNGWTYIGKGPRMQAYFVCTFYYRIVPSFTNFTHALVAHDIF